MRWESGGARASARTGAGGASDRRPARAPPEEGGRLSALALTPLLAPVDPEERIDLLLHHLRTTWGGLGGALLPRPARVRRDGHELELQAAFERYAGSPRRG
jgi:hypothetical protein